MNKLEEVMEGLKGIEPTKEDKEIAGALTLTVWSLIDGARLDLAEDLIARALAKARQGHVDRS